MLQKLNKMARYRTYFETADDSRLVAREAGDATVRAQQLHGRIYLEQGYITESDLGPDGIILPASDPYQDHSHYFSVVEATPAGDRTVGSARLITEVPGRGLDSFQTWQHMQLSGTGKRRIERYEPSRIVEVSALVKVPGSDTLATLMLYRRMWHYSLEQGYMLWLIACDDRLYRRLKQIFGATLRPVGPRQYYEGGMVVPTVIELPRALDLLLGIRTKLPIIGGLQQALSNFFLTGLSPDHLTPDQQRRVDRLQQRRRR